MEVVGKGKMSRPQGEIIGTEDEETPLMKASKDGSASRPTTRDLC